MATDPNTPNAAAVQYWMMWLVRWFAENVCASGRACREMIAAAIASTRAAIDRHGRALCLTRATRADSSVCGSCTRRSSSRGFPPNAIGQEGGAAG